MCKTEMRALRVDAVCLESDKQARKRTRRGGKNCAQRLIVLCKCALMC